MHSGIPWYLVIVLEAIVHWPLTLAAIAALAILVVYLFRKRRK